MSRLLPLLLAVALVAPSFADDSPLQLETIPIDGGTVHLDRDLTEHRDEIVTRIERFIEQGHERADRASRLRERSDAMLSAVNDLLGLDAKQRASVQSMQEYFYNELLGISLLLEPAEDFQVYVALTTNSKAHLRAGGTLPAVTYDPATDMATMKFGASLQSKGTVDDRQTWTRSQTRLPASITIPVDPSAPLEQLASVLAKFEQMPTLGVVLHEVVELTIVKVIQTKGFHWRWFSDGFATAGAEVVLRQMDMNDDADALRDAMLGDHDFENARHLVNLRYWPAKDVDPEVSIDYERRLQTARYAYSYLEAKRLIDEHGPEVVRKIIDAATRNESNTDESLIAAITTATGTPFKPRLDAYQGFETVDQGLNSFASSMVKGQLRQSLELELVAMLRFNEIQLSRTYEPLSYARIADILRRMGRGDEGMAVLRKQFDRFADQEPAISATAMGLRIELIELAFELDDLSLVEEEAQAVLAEDPNWAPAKIVLLDRLSRAGNAEAATLAKTIAARLPEHTPRQYHRALERIIGRVEAADTSR